MLSMPWQVNEDAFAADIEQLISRLGVEHSISSDSQQENTEYRLTNYLSEPKTLVTENSK